MKFLRTWNATIGGADGSTIEIGYPRSISFTVTRGMMFGLPQASIRIYNLSEDDRNNIFKDFFDVSRYNPISLRAGYVNEPAVPEIFRGSIMQAYNYKEGIDWVTEIQAMDGIYGIQNGQIAVPISAGYDAKRVLKQIIQSMPNVSIGAIGNLVMHNTRGRILFGNSWNEAVKFTYSWGTLFVDKEQVHFLGDDEYIDDGTDPLTIDSNFGLLNSPKRQDARIDVQLLFSPEIEVGRPVNLKSLETSMNGFYIVKGVMHRAMISPSVCGDAVSTLTFFRADPITSRAVTLPANSSFGNLAGSVAA